MTDACLKTLSLCMTMLTSLQTLQGLLRRPVKSVSSAGNTDRCSTRRLYCNRLRHLSGFQTQVNGLIVGEIVAESASAVPHGKLGEAKTSLRCERSFFPFARFLLSQLCLY